jgi:hypothetical protein
MQRSPETFKCTSDQWLSQKSGAYLRLLATGEVYDCFDCFVSLACIVNNECLILCSASREEVVFGSPSYTGRRQLKLHLNTAECGGLFNAVAEGAGKSYQGWVHEEKEPWHGWVTCYVSILLRGMLITVTTICVIHYGNGYMYLANTPYVRIDNPTMLSQWQKLTSGTRCGGRKPYSLPLRLVLSILRLETTVA